MTETKRAHFFAGFFRRGEVGKRESNDG